MHYNGHRTTDTSSPTPNLNSTRSSSSVLKRELETIHSGNNTPRNSLLVVDKSSPALSYKSSHIADGDAIDITPTGTLPATASTTSAASAKKKISKKSKSLPRKLSNDAIKQERLFDELMNQSTDTHEQKLLLSDDIEIPSPTEAEYSSESTSPLPSITVDPPVGLVQTLFFDSPNTTSLGHYTSYSCDSTHYERNTTPYTSIEDIGDALERELSSVGATDDEADQRVLPTRKLSEPIVSLFKTDHEYENDVKEKSPVVKRWHSFHNRNKIDLTEDADESNETQKKYSKDSSTLPFLRNRGHSFSKSRKQRPISVIGLVHTSNSEDLMELQKAQEQCHTPDVVTTVPLTASNYSPRDLPTIASSTASSVTTPTSTPTASHRKNRWSLLRSKSSRHKSSSKADVNPVSDIDIIGDLATKSSLAVDTEPEKKLRRNSRVTSLAREYSRKIKTDDRAVANRDTTPQWINVLKERRRRHSNSMPRQYDNRPTSSQDIPISLTGEELVDRSTSPLSAPTSPRSFDTFAYSTDSTLSNNSIDLKDFFNGGHSSTVDVPSIVPEGDGTLKRTRRSSGKVQEKPGWVRSLVKRFSGSKI